MHSTSTMPTRAAIRRPWKSSSRSATCARSPRIRSRRKRPGWQSRPPTRRRAACSTSTARRRAMNAGSTKIGVRARFPIGLNNARPRGNFPNRALTPISKQRGFTYVGAMIFVALAGAGLASYVQIASHAAQREKEAELLFRGNAFQAAIASYYKKEQRYPTSIETLLEDKRYPMPVRHLRKLYADPMTGEQNWALIDAPGGGFMGVHSRSAKAPIKTGNFLLRRSEERRVGKECRDQGGPDHKKIHKRFS